MAQAKQRTYISRRTVAEKALEIVDEAGVEGFNIRRLGARMGVNGASLYYHYRSKDDILEDATRQALRDLKLPDLESVDWIAWLVECNLGYRDALLQHPNVVPILLRGNPGRYRPRLVMDYLSESFLREGLSPDDIEWILEVLESFTIGLVLVAGIGHEGEVARGPVSNDAQFRIICRGLIELTVAATERASAAPAKRAKAAGAPARQVRKAK